MLEHEQYRADPLAFCLRCAHLTPRELRELAGPSLLTCRTRNLAFRIRRAGRVLLARPALIRELRGASMRAILVRCDEAGKGLVFRYK